MSRSKPTFASLFSGCGGLDLGFIEAGCTPLAAFDSDLQAVATYKKNIDSSVRCQDLSESFSAKSWSRSVDIVIAGPPCQGFSTVGKRDPKDPRNQLLSRAAEIAVSIRPKVIVLENVTGVTAGRQKRHWSKARTIFKSAGYRTMDVVCDAIELGLAQTRRRRLLMAWQNSFDGEFSTQKHPSRVLRQVLSNVDGLPNHEPIRLPAGSDAAIIAGRIKPDHKLCNVRASRRSVHTWNIPDVFGHTTAAERRLLEFLLRRRRQDRLRNFGDADPVSFQALKQFAGAATSRMLASLIEKEYLRKVGSRYDLVHTFNGKYRRLCWEAPAPTVHTRFGDPRYFLHPVEHRGMSVREAARIQGFPDWFIFEGRLRDQFRLVGNAVPPPIGDAVARFIKSNLL